MRISDWSSDVCSSDLQLAMWYGNWLHEGQLLDPTMRNIEKFLEDTQQHVTGQVYLTLHPYRFVVNGIDSAHDLMSARFGSYGEMNKGWTAADVKGFTKIFDNQTAIRSEERRVREKSDSTCNT